MNFIIFWNLTSNLNLHEPFWTQDNLTKTELIYQPNSSKILNFEPYELGLTQTLYSNIVDVISKQQIMNESVRGKKSGPAGCCCCCHSTRQILLLNTSHKRFINQAIVLRLKNLMQHYFFSFVSMSFMRWKNLFESCTNYQLIRISIMSKCALCI